MALVALDSAPELGCKAGHLVQDIPNIIKSCRAPGPLYLSSLSEDELKLLDNMMNRLYTIAEVAAKVSPKQAADGLCGVSHQGFCCWSGAMHSGFCARQQAAQSQQILHC